MRTGEEEVEGEEMKENRKKKKPSRGKH